MKIANQDTENTAKVQRRQWKLLNQCKKLLKVISTVFYDLPRNKFKYLKVLN